MLRRASRLLALVLLCGVGQAGASKADGPPFIAHLPQGTVELVGITHYPPTNQSRWWQPDGSAVQLGPFRPARTHRSIGDRKHDLLDTNMLTFLVRFQNPSADASILSGKSSSRNLPVDTSSPAKNPPTEQPSNEQEGYYQSSAEMSWPVWGINPSGPSWKVDHVAHVKTGVLSQRMNLFTPEWTDDLVVDANDNTVPNWWMFSALLSTFAQTADLRVGIRSAHGRLWQVRSPIVPAR